MVCVYACVRRYVHCLLSCTHNKQASGLKRLLSQDSECSSGMQAHLHNSSFLIVDHKPEGAALLLCQDSGERDREMWLLTYGLGIIVWKVYQGSGSCERVRPSRPNCCTAYSRVKAPATEAADPWQ